ncbi:Phospho-N-acetylmuramoyl-pentapeptide-transferase [Desulfacinum infernum DSM 9756]|jgi:phospho-N-acetylmuramoyl-pentapeptide-transferase|uniref:Phospho-N-acetylmuramoyl-pentapeptide-transferase n=1 Tax=Desulfacinum infernum DSM 9756 TaxID=1121391 RepID=A0A1M4YYB7_9BACT|nr:phospho-N-acetylmuramoyl-pentapeptide-transferase [Desulfacinum infernum]MBZ4658716.1 mraY [Desulfacinum sp.]SHF10705.1 Phospho-N-acetylmuramoyl-pentapeptide-transferase [Desulfacinum infernum DSM 9756]
MIFELGRILQEYSDLFSFLRLVNYLTFRAIMAALSAAVFMFVFSRSFIFHMHRLGFQDQERDTGLATHDKSGTPTMGGILIIGAVVFSLGLWGNWTSPFLLYPLIAMLWHGAMGFWDDYAKIRRGSGNRGMSERMKLLLQSLFSAGFAWAMVGPLSPVGPEMATRIYVPFIKYPLFSLHPVLYGIFIFLFVIFVSNAVNLTDGLDGLAITPSLFVVGVLGVFAYVEGNTIYSSYLFYPYLRGAGELTVFAAACVGAGLGFLWYNAYPAQIFMGDTGSLAIGGTMAVISVLLKQEFLFPILGGLFVAEALTSQIQDKIGVRWLGRRIFYRAPLHHNLQHKGIAETKVVIRLWIISGLLALMALATLKIR